MTAGLPSDRTFVYRDAAILLRGATSQLLDWLTEFQSPWFAIGTGSALPTAVLELTVDADAFRNRLTGAQTTGSEVACFTMDRGAVRLPLLRLADGDDAAVDAEAGIALATCATACHEPRRLELYAKTEDAALRLTILRSLRELAHGFAVGAGDLPLHAAAIADDDGTTLIVGPKRAGKSTLLVHALTYAGTRFVANDRAFVRVDARTAAVRGMPTIVGLRDGTLVHAPRVQAALDSGAWHYTSTLAQARADESARRLAPGLGSSRPPGLSPAQLCALLGVVPHAGGPVVRLVFSELGQQPTPQRFAIRPLAPAEVAARLRADGLVAGGKSAHFLGGTPARAASFTDAIATLARVVPSFHCLLGPDAYDPPSVWEALRSIPSNTQNAMRA